MPARTSDASAARIPATRFSGVTRPKATNTIARSGISRSWRTTALASAGALTSGTPIRIVSIALLLPDEIVRVEHTRRRCRTEPVDVTVDGELGREGRQQLSCVCRDARADGPYGRKPGYTHWRHHIFGHLVIWSFCNDE